jgi:hypothetical protein
MQMTSFDPHAAERAGRVAMAEAQLNVAQQRYDRLLDVAQEADEREQAARSRHEAARITAAATLAMARSQGTRGAAAAARGDRDAAMAAVAPYQAAVAARVQAFAAAENAREEARGLARQLGHVLADTM